MIKITNGKTVFKKTEEKSVYIKDGKIFAVTNEELPHDGEIDAGGCYISAGFIDTHVHGGGNYDFMDSGTEPIVKACKTHMMHGTTTIYPTTLAADRDELYEAVKNIKKVADSETDIPHIEGIHMEGPYLSPAQAGAQNPEYITPPVREEYEKMLAESGGFIKKWTYAPEVENADVFYDFMIQNGIIPFAGHTDADYAEIERAYKKGLRNVTHYYSGMSSLHRVGGYRILGAIESVYLFDDMNVEIIADGCHLPPELLRLIYKIKGSDHICAVTDAMRGAGMGDGMSVLGSEKHGSPCIIEDGVAKVMDRSCFAGSVATTDRLVRTLYKKAGISLEESVKMATETPARIMGLESKGKLQEGCDADLVIFDDDINIKKVILSRGGETKIYENR